MDIEELTTTQVILLVLLVSFVTSIATGIVTVSLLAQAPPAVTQTVNHIIERTVESVTPAATSAATVTHETTVVVKEDDLVTKSIADSFARIGRIHSDTSTSSPVIALGSLIGSGMIITDLTAVAADDPRLVTFGNSMATYRVTSTFPDIGISILTATGTMPTLTTFKTSDVSSLKLGQSVIALFGLGENRVGLSTVSGESQFAILKVGDSNVNIRTVDTTLDRTLTPGTPLITVFGDLVGISTGAARLEDQGSFVALSDVMNAITAKAKPAATSTPSN